MHFTLLPTAVRERPYVSSCVWFIYRPSLTAYFGDVKKNPRRIGTDVDMLSGYFGSLSSEWCCILTVECLGELLNFGAGNSDLSLSVRAATIALVTPDVNHGDCGERERLLFRGVTSLLLSVRPSLPRFQLLTAVVFIILQVLLS
jgi:hypothetical protein